MTAAASDDVRSDALPLRDAAHLDPLLERVGSARLVGIGEASHGTHEFYAWRAELTRRLIVEKGFAFVAVEGDWPDCHAVHCSVTGGRGSAGDPREVLRAFDRWPTWMWANEEVLEFARWLRGHNDGLPPAQRVGFHGLDVYSLFDPLRAYWTTSRSTTPTTCRSRSRRFVVSTPTASTRSPTPSPADWSRPAARRRSSHCCANCAVPIRHRATVAALWTHASSPSGTRRPPPTPSATTAMVSGGPASWNVRDCHMADTLDRLLSAYGSGDDTPAAKAVLWEHNTHIGDARATDMADAGMVNVGQLVRERHGRDDVVLVGFGTHRGGVIASPRLDGPVQPRRRARHHASGRGPRDGGRLGSDVPDGDHSPPGSRDRSTLARAVKQLLSQRKLRR